MRDRLTDLPGCAPEEANSQAENASSAAQSTIKKKKWKSRWKKRSDDQSDNIEMRKMKRHQQQSSQMVAFFRQVEAIKEDIETIKQATKSISHIREAAFQATTTEEENSLSQRLRLLISQTNECAMRSKNCLELLDKETKRLRDKRNIKSSELRMRENVCLMLMCKFTGEMKAYQAAQMQYKTDLKKKIKRQIQIVKPSATEEEIDDVMRSDGGRDSWYRECILAGNLSNEQAKTTYIKVHDKHQDLLALEQSMAEIHQMFLDFALLTEHQGEMLDQIEFQVKKAGDEVEHGNVNLYKSLEYLRKIRKRSGWIILIVVIATVVILALLAG